MITKRDFILRGSFFVISIILLSGNELHSIETLILLSGNELHSIETLILLSGNELHSIETLLQQLVRALKLTTLTLWQHIALSTAHEPRPVLIRCIDFS